MLRGRRVVLGVSGGVAAYKAAYLARRFVEAGAEVRAIMTPSMSPMSCRSARLRAR